MDRIVATADLPPETKKAGIYEVGEVHYESAVRRVKGFNLYHGGRVSYGLAGLHWTAKRDLAHAIAGHSTGKVLTRFFSVSDRFQRINDNVEHNHLLYYSDTLFGRDSALSKQMVDRILAMYKGVKVSEKSKRFTASSRISELAFEAPDKKTKKLIVDLYAIFLPEFRKLGIAGLVYYNEIEGGAGDSFITFED